MSVKRRNMELFLMECFKQSIAIKDDNLKKSQEVFKSVFEQVKTKMGEQCNYFAKYSSQVVYGGSVSDGIKVSKLDEFDMDIVIRLPINYDEGITLENDQPGFVKLKIENAFDNLDKQPNWESCHKVTRDWRDSDKYFLQNRFRQWMHGIVQKALNTMDGKAVVNGVTYLLKYKESGPAYTLNIRNVDGDDEFKLDVDLVPVIRFMHPRWPQGYREIAGFQVKDWLVVPKPNKYIQNGSLKNRCWRLSFQDFEREMIKGCQQLKTTIRLVKKLRDTLDMRTIASYYIKTLFLWKVDETKDKKYWQKPVSVLFRVMVQELHDAIDKKNIRYFWHESNNLIETLKPSLQKLYCENLKKVLDALDANDVEKVIGALLTSDELREFKKSDFYKQQPEIPLQPIITRQGSTSSLQESQVLEQIKALQNQVADQKKRMDKLERENSEKTKTIEDLNYKVDELSNSVKLLLRNSASEKNDLLKSQSEMFYKQRFEDMGVALGIALDMPTNKDDNPKRVKRAPPKNEPSQLDLLLFGDELPKPNTKPTK